MRAIRIFLASSAELRQDRDEFRLSIADLNDNWLHRGVRLQVVAWESFIDAMSPTRLQDEYNRALADCDLFVMLFWSKVGRYTREEFETAFGHFQARRRPFVYTYFRTTPPAAEVPAADRDSLADFQRRLQALQHFQTEYDSAAALNLHFQRQLDRLAAQGFIELTPEATTPAVPMQAPPIGPEHVARPAELRPLKAALLDAQGRLQAASLGLHGMGGVGKTTLARLLCADPAVRDACRDGILWTTLGTRAGDARERLASLVVALAGDDPGCATLDGARARLQALLAGRRVLLVIDDIWDEAAVRELLDASSGCARVLTTRHPALLPWGTQRFDVGTMAPADASALLGLGLARADATKLGVLAARLGHWPVLLRLANGRLREEAARGLEADTALDATAATLDRHGVLGFDPAQPAGARDQAVAATVDASLALLREAERQRYAELAIFPQDVPIPLAQVAELWQLTAGLDDDDSRDLVATRLDALSLLDYDAASGRVHLHDVLRRYLLLQLGAARGALHQRLADHWGDTPSRGRRYAWRWLAHQRAQAAIASEGELRHARAASLLALAGSDDWQRRHQAALQDLPALRDALRSALDAAVADDSPAGLPLLVRAADACVRFDRQHERATPVFEAARDGALDIARRRADLLALDPHWRQVLLLAAVWLSPPSAPGRQALFDEIAAEARIGPTSAELADWVQADLVGTAAPAFAPPALPQRASRVLVEQLVARLGGQAVDAELLKAHGVAAPAAHGPMPTRGIASGRPGASPDDPGTASDFLARQDGPWLVDWACQDADSGREMLERYLGVFADYGYAEYRQSSCWWLLAALVRWPEPTHAGWLRDAVVRVIETAVGGGSVQFEQATPVAALALAAAAGVAPAGIALHAQAQRLYDQASRIACGRERGDTWGHHKRRLAAHAEASGWLHGDTEQADALLAAALALADSGFAGYQAPACLALAECARVLAEGDPPADDPRCEQALQHAQEAAHNVQDPTFCARSTARIHALRRHWWPGFDISNRARELREGARGEAFSGLHLVGHDYAGRRPGSLPPPSAGVDDRHLGSLALLYRRPWQDLARLNDPGPVRQPGDEMRVPDPGLPPLAAARIAAEVLACAGGQPLSPARRRLLRALVPAALANPSALDAVLARVVLAQARDGATMAQAAALQAALDERPVTPEAPAGAETLTRLPA